MVNDIKMRSSTEKFQWNRVMHKNDLFFSNDNNEQITNLST